MMRHLLPAVEEADRAVDIGIPCRARRCAVWLHPAVTQTHNGTAFRAVDLQRQQIVAPHAHTPRGVEVRDDAAVQLERRIRGIVGGAIVRFPSFVPALRNVRSAEARDGLDLVEQIVEHIPEMTEHVDDDATAVLLAIVPRRTLSSDCVAFEYPI